jgi:hypothetical protein
MGRARNSQCGPRTVTKAQMYAKHSGFTPLLTEIAVLPVEEQEEGIATGDASTRVRPQGSGKLPRCS